MQRLVLGGLLAGAAQFLRGRAAAHGFGPDRHSLRRRHIATEVRQRLFHGAGLDVQPLDAAQRCAAHPGGGYGAPGAHGVGKLVGQRDKVN